MNTPKDQRLYRLPAAANRREGEERRQKKLEEPRETLKTTEGFALATWEHLRAYFVHGVRTFRITVLSSTRRLTKKRYILAAKAVWGAKSGKLFELFHGYEEYGPTDNRKTRKVGLIYSRGAIDLQDPTVSLRWLQDEASAFATHSLIGFGADSESTGERSDLTICDTLSPKLKKSFLAIPLSG